MKLKQGIKEGQCDAMRCNAPPTHTVTSPIAAKLCVRHYGEAIAEHGALVGSHGAVMSIDTPRTSTALVLPPEVEQLEAEGMELAQHAQTFAIANREDMDFARDILVEVKTRLKTLDEIEKSITRPMNDALKNARALFKPARTKFEEIEQIMKRAIAEFSIRQDAHNAAAAAAASTAHIAGDEEGTQIALDQMASTHDAEGISIRHTWQFEIMDADLVPRFLCSPDPKKIREWMNQQIATARLLRIPSDQITVLHQGVDGIQFSHIAGVAVRT